MSEDQKYKLTAKWLIVILLLCLCFTFYAIYRTIYTGDGTKAYSPEETPIDKPLPPVVENKDYTVFPKQAKTYGNITSQNIGGTLNERIISAHSFLGEHYVIFNSHSTNKDVHAMGVNLAVLDSDFTLKSVSVLYDSSYEFICSKPTSSGIIALASADTSAKLVFIPYDGSGSRSLSIEPIEQAFVYSFDDKLLLVSLTANNLMCRIINLRNFSIVQSTSTEYRGNLTPYIAPSRDNSYIFIAKDDTSFTLYHYSMRYNSLDSKYSSNGSFIECIPQYIQSNLRFMLVSAQSDSSAITILDTDFKPIMERVLPYTICHIEAYNSGYITLSDSGAVSLLSSDFSPVLYPYSISDEHIVKLYNVSGDLYALTKTQSDSYTFKLYKLTNNLNLIEVTSIYSSSFVPPIVHFNDDYISIFSNSSFSQGYYASRYGGEDIFALKFSLVEQSEPTVLE